MVCDSRITRVEASTFSFPTEDKLGFNLVYDPGEVYERKVLALKMETDVGITAKYVGVGPMGQI